MAFTEPDLIDYARLLTENGFTIYEPNSRSEYFLYSREVDGRECVGIVGQCTLRLSGYYHSMPIRPSREHGSAMFVPGIDDGYDHLTVEAAERVARPTNTNECVGTHENFKDPRDESMYSPWQP